MIAQNRTIGKLTFTGMLFLMLFFCAAVRVRASWLQNADGSFSYQRSDGTLAADTWIGKNYYVNSDGVRLTGKQEIGDSWYYFSPESGKLVKNQWIRDGESRFYALKDGSLYAGGICEIDKYSYLFDSEGVMQTGMCTYRKKTYYLLPKNGRMLTDTWIKYEDRFYFFDKDGVLQKNKWLENDTYYVGEKGYRLTDHWKNGRYLDESGKACSGLCKVDGEHYYFDPKTKKKTVNKVIVIKGKRWQFDSEGVGTRSSVPAPGAGVTVQPEYYTQPVVDDETLLSYIIYCEAGNQAYEGKLAVGYVIMNRVYSKVFRASTVREVIYQKKQFNPVWDGAMARVFRNPSIVTEECREAAEYVMKWKHRFAEGKPIRLKVNGKKINFPYLFYMRLESYHRLGLSAPYNKIGDHVFFTTWR